MRYAKLRQTNADLFPLPWRIDGELNPEQVNELQRAGERKGSQPATKIDIEGVAHVATNVGGNLEQGRPKEAAPQEQKRVQWVEVVALGIAFILPTLASAFNTYRVSHELSKDGRVSLFVMCMVMLTPALFIVARMGGAGVFVAFAVVAFESFCNTAATYLSLMGNMEYILDGKRGQCSVFLQSVVELTSSDHRPTAVLLGLCLAVLIAATQLTAFWGIRKRF